MDHLACFAAGMYGLAAHEEKDANSERWMDIAKVGHPHLHLQHPTIHLSSGYNQHVSRELRPFRHQARPRGLQVGPVLIFISAGVSLTIGVFQCGHWSGRLESLVCCFSKQKLLKVRLILSSFPSSEFSKELFLLTCIDSFTMHSNLVQYETMLCFRVSKHIYLYFSCCVLSQHC